MLPRYGVVAEPEIGEGAEPITKVGSTTRTVRPASGPAVTVTTAAWTRSVAVGASARAWVF